MREPRTCRLCPPDVLLHLLLAASVLGAVSCTKKPVLTLEPQKRPLPAIQTVQHSASQGARAGDTVEFTLRGDPGFEASVSLPGLAREVVLEEDSPGQGVYTGALLIPANTEGGVFSLEGQLGIGDRHAVKAGPPLTVIKQDLASQQLTCAQINQRGILRTVYFDFDKYDLRPDAIATLEENLQYIRRRSDLNWLLEGHCDERGTNEYNMALGDKRANEVREFLRRAGISSLRLSTISYGEERPADPGHNERAWAKNRRVEFVCNQ